jgi:hypothetical protein
MKELNVVESTHQATAITPMSMLNMAVSQGADLDKLEKLMALQERYEANEARKAFTKALSDFKAVGVSIDKDKHVKYGNTEYNHATLGNICNIIGSELSKFGLSYRWNTEQNDGKIKVTCVLMHILGHSESVSLESGADSSGSKNAIQAIGSTVSYLQRYTLLAITGTATQEQDDDGESFGLKDIMDEGRLCDCLAGIEAATSKADVAKVYLAAIQESSSLGDQGAMDRLNTAKDAQLSKLSVKK